MILKNIVLKNLTSIGEYGLEKESLRVNTDGSLAQSEHPFLGNPHISRDFCENQIEIITDVFDSVDGLIAQLEQIHRVIYAELKSRNELLWCFSNPPRFTSSDEIPVAKLDDNGYRLYLAEKYGKVKMLFSGIHMNFSFPNELLKAWFEASGSADFLDFKNTLYLELAAKLTAYSWLIVYLTAASPVLDSSFAENGGIDASELEKYASVRCGERGYWNFFTPILNYSSLEKYIESIEKYISSGELKSESELYYPIRLKPSGKNSLSRLGAEGISHIELRLLDVNPLSEVGIFKEDISFIHLLMLYLLSLNYEGFDASSQKKAIKNIKSAALYDDKSARIDLGAGETDLRTAALAELEKIEKFVEENVPEFSDTVRCQKSKITNENARYADKIRMIYSENYNEKGIELAKKRREVV